MQQVVKVTIENGVPTIHVQGVKGKSCKDITKALEAALGETSKFCPLPEMYEQVKKTTKASN
jgi:DUF2997 family protein